MSLLRRRMMMAKKPSGGGGIFPMHLNLEKVASYEYRLDPTPESIALCDYLNEHLEWNGMADWECYFEPGQLFIDGIGVEVIMMSGTEQQKFYRSAYWYSHHSRYDEWWCTTYEIYLDDELYPKGTIRVYDDD